MRTLRTSFVVGVVSLLPARASAEPTQQQRVDQLKPLSALIKITDRQGEKKLHSIGSAVLVHDDPPTFATCFHVLRNRDPAHYSIEVWTGSMKDNPGYEIKEVAAFPDDDLAFVRIEKTTWPAATGAWNGRILASNAAAVTALANRTVYVSSYGAGAFSFEVRGLSLVDTPLVSFGSILAGMAITPSPKAQNLSVLNISSGTHLKAGESGAPILVEENGTYRVAGLAAGGFFVIPGQHRGYVAVTFAERHDLARAAFRPVTASALRGNLPYADSAIGLFMALMTQEFIRVPGTVAEQSCVEPIADLLSRYVGTRSSLPMSLPSGAPATCDAYYVRLRPLFIEEERDRLAAATLTELVEQARVIELAAQDLANAELKKHEQLLDAKRKTLTSALEKECVANQSASAAGACHGWATVNAQDKITLEAQKTTASQLSAQFKEGKLDVKVEPIVAQKSALAAFKKVENAPAVVVTPESTKLRTEASQSVAPLLPGTPDLKAAARSIGAAAGSAAVNASEPPTKMLEVAAQARSASADAWVEKQKAIWQTPRDQLK